MVTARLLLLVLCGILLRFIFASEQLTEEIPLTEEEAQAEREATEENETDPSPKEEKVIPIQVPPEEDEDYLPTEEPENPLMSEGNGNHTEEEEAEDEHGNEQESALEQDEEVVSTLPKEATPTPVQDDITYVFSRLSDLDMALYRLNVQYSSLEFRLTQNLVRLQDKLNRVLNTVEELSQKNTKNQREIGRIAGCLKGKKVGRKCFYMFHQFETYDTAQNICHNSGGNLAMPKSQEEYAGLAQYARNVFHPGNWPIWIGIHDRRDEGLYLYQDGYRVSFFHWYKDFLVSQPNGGKQENCVAISSDDGKWWDNDCIRRMYFLCEYEF